MLEKCPVCGSTNIDMYFNVEKLPVFQNMIYRTYEDAVSCLKGEISICECKNCGFRFNRSFESEQLVYTNDYDIRQEKSLQFKHHICKVTELINNVCNFDGKVVLEVGCGKGFFLNKVAEKYSSTCIGYDPSYETDRNFVINNRIEFRQRNFTEQEIRNFGEKTDIIILRHVIEHLQNPLEIIMMLKKVMSKQGYLYIETPSYDWIEQNGTIFDHTYEHCSYFSDDFIKILIQMAGMEIVSLKHTFEGQYLSVIVKRKTYAEKISYIPQIKDNAKNMKILLSIKRYFEVEGLKHNICLWGAAGKGVMCCNLFDNEKKYIAGVIDISESKQGAFIAGTGHPIWSPVALLDAQIDLVIVVNGNYMQEVSAIINEVNPKIQIKDIKDIKDILN